MTQTDRPALTKLPAGLGMALLLNLIWVNFSEVVRYFAFVMPMMRAALPGVPGVAAMDVPIFLIWGIWDMIVILAITGLSWLIFERFGATRVAAICAGTAAWLGIFVVLWLGLFNMNLATPEIVLTALPLAWIEMIVAALIVRWAMRRGTTHNN
jgi:hypothetical protein